MSTSETVKQQSNQAAARIASLTHLAIPTDDFYGQVLDALPLPPGTWGTVAWIQQAGAFQKLAVGSTNLQQRIELPFGPREHARMLAAAVANGQPSVHRPPETPHPNATEPTVPLAVIFPVFTERDQAVVLEVFLESDLNDESVTAFVNETSVLCDIAANFHFHRSSEPQPAPPVRFDSTIYRSLRLLDTSYVIANEARRLLACDRVTVLSHCGNKCKVEAISGQEATNRRANVVRYLEVLVNSVLGASEPVWYPREIATLPPQIQEPLEYYIEISLCRGLGVVPLIIDKADDEETADQRASEHPDGRVVGALVVEDFTEATQRDESYYQRVKALADDAAVAVANAARHENIFLLPLWEWTSRQGQWLRGKQRRTTLAITAAMAVAILLLLFLPARFHVSVKGRLLPAERSNVFARADGVIESLHVHHGSEVGAGDLLVTMRSSELDLAMQRIQGEIQELTARASALRAHRLSQVRPTPADTGLDVAAEEAQIKEQLASLQKQLAIQARQADLLSVRSPIRGEVTTWNLDDRLRNRPVGAGQLLVEVADLDGPWIVELRVPDRRVAHVLRAAQSENEPLPIEFVLASDPHRKHLGNVAQIAKAMRVERSEGHNLLVTVRLDEARIDCQRSGTDVHAKIDCGRRRLGFVLLHDFGEFIQTHILFRFF